MNTIYALNLGFRVIHTMEMENHLPAMPRNQLFICRHLWTAVDLKPWVYVVLGTSLLFLTNGFLFVNILEATTYDPNRYRSIRIIHSSCGAVRVYKIIQA